MNVPPFFFVFDAESVGLHGQAFAVAGGVYRIDGTALREFAYHCPSGRASGNIEDRKWVEEHVTTHPSESKACSNPFDLRELFWIEWCDAKENHPGIQMAVECGWPVEANFLRACIGNDIDDRKWSGPYPMHEIASIMLAAGMDPMATYDRLPHELPAHEPLADARLSARLLSTAVQKIRQTV